MRIAVATYPIDAPRSFGEFADKQRRWLREAADGGARLAVLPEYLALELAAQCAPAVREDAAASFAALQAFRADWCALFAGLAQELGLCIAAGSFLLETAPGRYRNRADLFSPDGSHVFQDKLQLTGFEKRTGVIAPGDALKVFEIDGLRLGIAICYDIEFPLPVRAQREAGAQLILCPSCTDTAAGATRVEVGCLARALENRCFIAKAVTAGEAPWSAVLDTNTGAATVYAPMDVGLPADGVLARQPAHGWAFADTDVQRLAQTRDQAQVANDRDWSGQQAPQIVQARVERLAGC